MRVTRFLSLLLLAALLLLAPYATAKPADAVSEDNSNPQKEAVANSDDNPPADGSVVVEAEETEDGVPVASGRIGVAAGAIASGSRSGNDNDSGNDNEDRVVLAVRPVRNGGPGGAAETRLRKKKLIRKRVPAGTLPGGLASGGGPNKRVLVPAPPLLKDQVEAPPPKQQQQQQQQQQQPRKGKDEGEGEDEEAPPPFVPTLPPLLTPLPPLKKTNPGSGDQPDQQQGSDKKDGGEKGQTNEKSDSGGEAATDGGEASAGGDNEKEGNGKRRRSRFVFLNASIPKSSVRLSVYVVPFPFFSRRFTTLGCVMRIVWARRILLRTQ